MASKTTWLQTNLIVLGSCQVRHGNSHCLQEQSQIAEILRSSVISTIGLTSVLVLCLKSGCEHLVGRYFPSLDAVGTTLAVI